MADKFNRYEHSVIDVTRKIAMCASGSYQETTADNIPELIEWLLWRLRDGWEETSLVHMSNYDADLRDMGFSALLAYDLAFGGVKWKDEE